VLGIKLRPYFFGTKSFAEISDAIHSTPIDARTQSAHNARNITQENGRAQRKSRHLKKLGATSAQ
jgi:hypothetical protein